MLSKSNLVRMKGRTYLFKNKRYTVQDIGTVNGKAEIYTNEGMLTVTERELRTFKPIKQEPQKEISLPILYNQDNGQPLTSVLRDTLLAAIEKVKLDKQYIAQANAINNTARTIIDLARIEIEVVRISQKRD